MAAEVAKNKVQFTYRIGEIARQKLCGNSNKQSVNKKMTTVGVWNGVGLITKE